jgi:hypothetical protein
MDKPLVGRAPAPSPPQGASLLADPSVPAENRIGALRAINDHTIDRIRGFLNEDQRQKYYPSGPPATPGTSRDSNLDDVLKSDGQTKKIRRME